MTSKSSVRVSQISYVIQQIKNYICVHIESVYHNHQLFSRKQGYFKNLLLEPKRIECGTLNLDNTSGNGTHWVAWYRDNGKNYYFDSYGIQPPTELKRYLRSRYFIIQSRYNLNKKCSADICVCMF